MPLRVMREGIPVLFDMSARSSKSGTNGRENRSHGRPAHAERAIIAAETRPLKTKMPPVASESHPAHSKGAQASESIINPRRRERPARDFRHQPVLHDRRFAVRVAMFPGPRR